MVGPCRIRTAHPGDARAVAVLEHRCFGDPWSVDSFREAFSPGWTFGLIAEEGLDLVGYLVGRAVAGSGEILNLAIAPEHRRRGHAKRLLEAGLLALAARGATEAYLEVRASNLEAQALYAADGFVQVGVRRGYYRLPVEDALVLRRAIGGTRRDDPAAALPDAHE